MRVLVVFILVCCAAAQIVAQSDLQVNSGTELQGGIGNFGDPTLHHGLALTFNGAIGSSSAPNVFTYDAFSVNARWVPGTNKLGKRIAITFGAANWFNPALKLMYKDTVLTADEKVVESKTANALMAGIAIQLLDTRVAEESDFTASSAQRTQLDLELAKAISEGNEAKRREVLLEIAQLNWKEVLRPRLRKASWLVGANFRLDDLGTETKIDVYDLYTTIAKGKGLFDCSVTARYLRPLNDQLIAKDAYTASLGLFFDLDDLPPVNTLGLIFGVGKYNYREKTRDVTVASVDYTLRDKPNTIRYDVTLSFTDLFKDSGPLGSGIAFRYSYLNNSGTKDDNQFNILLTTKFVNSKKKN